MESPRRFVAPPLTRGAFGRVWDPPLRKYRKLSGERRGGRSRPARPGTKCGSGRAGEDTRPYENTGSCPVNAVGAGPRSARRSRIMFGARRRGASPSPTKDGRSKKWRKPSRRAAVCRPYGFTRAHLSNGRAGEDTRPLQGEERLQVCRRGRRPRRPAAAQCAPLQREKGSMPCAHWGSYPRGDGIAGGASPSPTVLKNLFRNWGRGGPWASADHVPAATSSATPGAGAGPQQRQFSRPGPSGRREFRHSLRFCAPKIQCQAKGVTLVMGVLGGGRHGGREALPNLPIAPTP